jgi:hypothetical protein
MEDNMKSRLKLAVLVMGIFTAFFAATVEAADFSADMINTSKGKVLKSKIFMTKDKIRLETHESIMITRMDKKVVWILMPNDKMYMEQSFNPEKAPATSKKVEGEIERKLIGQEVIDGRKTDKYQITYTQRRRKSSMFQWIASGIEVPVKMAAVDNSWITEYKNIKTSRPSGSLFEIPAGYRSFSAKDVFKGLAR